MSPCVPPVSEALIAKPKNTAEMAGHIIAPAAELAKSSVCEQRAIAMPPRISRKTRRLSAFCYLLRGFKLMTCCITAILEPGIDNGFAAKVR